MKKEYERFHNFLEKLIESRTEYEEHGDAGDNYAHLVKEGPGIDEERFNYWLEDNEIIVPKEIRETLKEKIYDTFEMETGSVFGCSKSNVFVIDSYEVGEIEEQFELSMLREEFGKFARGFWLKEGTEKDFCLRGLMGAWIRPENREKLSMLATYSNPSRWNDKPNWRTQARYDMQFTPNYRGHESGYSYDDTDAVWFAVVTKEHVLDLIEEIQDEVEWEKQYEKQ